MAGNFGRTLFTPVVKELQTQHGSRRQYERMTAGEGEDRLGEFEREFLAERESFYMATTSATGWPYVQHRGGPKGFLRMIDERTIAFADFGGNKQYISAGNLTTDDRAALILVDYPRQARLKVLARVEILEGAAAEGWAERVRVTGYSAMVERVFVLRVEALDWNCPQHITRRYTVEEIGARVRGIEERMAGLERENARLREENEALGAGG